MFSDDSRPAYVRDVDATQREAMAAVLKAGLLRDAVVRLLDNQYLLDDESYDLLEEFVDRGVRQLWNSDEEPGIRLQFHTTPDGSVKEVPLSPDIGRTVKATKPKIDEAQRNLRLFADSLAEEAKHNNQSPQLTESDASELWRRTEQRNAALIDSSMGELERLGGPGIELMMALGYQPEWAYKPERSSFRLEIPERVLEVPRAEPSQRTFWTLTRTVFLAVRNHVCPLFPFCD
jgi:hypothetical protein